MIFRYLFTRVLLSFVMVLSGFVLLEFILSGLNELTYQTRHDYQALQAFEFLLHSTPARISQFGPSILLLSILVGLGSLASSSELTVLRASGISVARIIAMAMTPLLLVYALLFTLGEFWAPKLLQQANITKAALRQERQIGGWHREQNWLLHAERIEREELQSVMLYQLNADFTQLEGIFHAQSAEAVADGWLLKQVRERRFSERPFREHSHAQWHLPFKADAELMTARVMDPRSLTLTQNLRFLQYMQQQRLAADALAFSFWQRIYMPLLAVMMMFAGATFVFGSNRSMAMSSRIFIGLVAGILLQLLQDLLAPLSQVVSWPIPVVTAIPLFISLAIALHLTRKVS